MATKDSKYNIAIDGQGYMLKGVPRRSRRIMERAPVFGNRFASGDRDFTDFSIWWYWAQTDWSGGVKKQRAWSDDAKFWFSTGIDAFSEQGAIKLAPGFSLQETFSEVVNCISTVEAPAGTVKQYAGTTKNTNIKLYQSDTDGVLTAWTEKAGSSYDANLTNMQIIRGHKSHVWTGAVGANGDADIVEKYDGSSTFTDYTSAINTALSITNISECTSILDTGNRLYVAVYSSSDDTYAIVYTDDNGTGWTVLLENTSGGKIEGMQIYTNGDLYYTVYFDKKVEARKYDISASVDIRLGTINIGKSRTEPVNKNLDKLIPFQAELIFTVSGGATIEQLWKIDSSDNITLLLDAKSKHSDNASFPFVTYGGLVKDELLYFQNLVYDGEAFYNYSPQPDTASVNPPMIYGLSNNTIVFSHDSDPDTRIYTESGYQSNSNRQYIFFNEVTEVSTINKLFNELVIVFDTLQTGDGISIDYDIGDGMVNLGSATFANDGAIDEKKFKFGTNIIGKKILFKIYLNSTGSTTPILRDISLQYLPIPDYKYRWSFDINCNDSIQLLDDQTAEVKNGVHLRNTLRESFLSQEIVVLEDVDYKETLLNGALTADATTITVDSTEGFPEKGRGKIEDEEIEYTAKTATTFTGVTRGARGTYAVSHNDNTLISNKYDVIILDYKESTPTQNEATVDDFNVSVDLIEA